MSDFTWLEDFGTKKAVLFEPKNLREAIQTLAYDYAAILKTEIMNSGSFSSGEMSKSVAPLKVKVNGTIYECEIVAKDYFQFVDEGVDGWANKKGGKFQFKTKGVPPEMVKSLKAYIAREGLQSRNVKVSVGDKEVKGKSLQDRQALSLAYMIKRQGIKPRHFTKFATAKIQQRAKVLLGDAFKVDIINSFK